MVHEILKVKLHFLGLQSFEVSGLVFDWDFDFSIEQKKSGKPDWSWGHHLEKYDTHGTDFDKLGVK